MRDFAGKTAFVTGAASGIGLALAQAFAEAGMKVMLADIERSALDAAVANLKKSGAEARGVLCDVSDRVAVKRAAEETIAAFGKVHVLCNNAGVGGGGPMEQIPLADWDWVLGVNLMGVIYGIHAFLPQMKAHGEEGHVVNTASMAGLGSPPGMGPYNVTKHAVVTLSETLAGELMGSNIGVSVLCPGWVNTRINESRRNRPERFGPAGTDRVNPSAMAESIAQMLRTGMDPKEVAARVMAAIRDNDLYIVTHPQMRGGVEERQRRILAAFDKAAAFKK